MAQTSIGPVFMSYSRKDEAVMQHIVTFLREQGINVWVDNEKLVPGTPIWEVEIEKAIRAAAAVVVLLSPDSNASIWVRREISFAERYNKRIFPVMVAGDEDTSIMLRLTTSQYVDIRQKESVGLDSLKVALSFYLEQLEAKEQREKEEAEKLVREKAEWEAAEKAAREKAEREAEEKVAREKAEQETLEKAAREKAEREAMEREVRERVEREFAERIVSENANIEHGSLKKTKRTVFWRMWIKRAIPWVLRWVVGWSIGLVLGWAIGEGLTDFTIMLLGESIGLNIGWAVGGIVGEMVGGVLTIIVIQNEFNFSKHNLKSSVQSLAGGFKLLFRDKPILLLRSLQMTIKNAFVASSNSKMLSGIGLGWYFSGALGWANAGSFGWVIGWIIGGLVTLFLIMRRGQEKVALELSIWHRLEFSWKNLAKSIRGFTVTIIIIGIILGFADTFTLDRSIPEIVMGIGIGFYYGFIKSEKDSSAKQSIENNDSVDPIWLRLVSSAWGFLGFLIWGSITIIGFIFLFVTVLDELAYLATPIFLLAVAIGIERWNPWKNVARNFLHR